MPAASAEKLYIVKYYEAGKVATTAVKARNPCYSHGMYSLLSTSGEVVFEIPKESFISLVKEEKWEWICKRWQMRCTPWSQRPRG